MRARAKAALVVFCLWALAAVGTGQPALDNPSFEADRFSVWPGYARGNGGAIAGWVGGSGVNPIWRKPKEQRGPEAPFLDNGAVPDGKQVAFIQGPGMLRQSITGFRRGARYQVTYRENARIQRPPGAHEWPLLQVTLGGEVVVSPHEVTPVGRIGEAEAPFCRVVGAVFTAPQDGACELVFQTLQKTACTALLDDVHIVELGGRST